MLQSKTLSPEPVPEPLLRGACAEHPNLTGDIVDKTGSLTVSPGCYWASGHLV